MFAMFGVFGLLLLGLALDASSGDDEADDTSEARAADETEAEAALEPREAQTADAPSTDEDDPVELLYSATAAEADDAPSTPASPTQISNFDPAAEQIVIFYDDPQDGDPEIELEEDADADETRVTALGEVIAVLNGTGYSADDIALINEADI